MIDPAGNRQGNQPRLKITSMGIDMLTKEQVKYLASCGWEHSGGPEAGCRSQAPGMTLPASIDANLLEFLQLRSLRRPQSFSQFQLSHRPRLGGSPFLRQGRAREPQAHLERTLRSSQ